MKNYRLKSLTSRLSPSAYRLSSGSIILGFCLNMLITLSMVAGGLYLGNKAGIIPSPFDPAPPHLQMSAVYHGDQMTWCYDAVQFQLSDTPNENTQQARQVSDFVTFIRNDLKKFATQITHLSEQQAIVVTWQATPHNQCQIVFVKANDDGTRVEVKRRQFSEAATIEAAEGHYQVKAALAMHHVSKRQSTLESLGHLTQTQHQITFADLQQALSISDASHLAGVQLTDEQSAFMTDLFRTTPREATPEESTQQGYAVFQNTLFNASYERKTEQDVNRLYRSWGN